MAHLEARRRLLKAKGRIMTLRHVPSLGASPIDVDVLGWSVAYRPDQLTGDIRQGDRRVSILNDEIVAAAWPGPPRARQAIVIEGRTWTLQGADAIYEGIICIGHDLWVRGG